MQEKLKVLIIDDHPLMRRGIKQLVELEENFEVVADVGKRYRRYFHCDSRIPGFNHFRSEYERSFWFRHTQRPACRRC